MFASRRRMHNQLLIFPPMLRTLPQNFSWDAPSAGSLEGQCFTVQKSMARLARVLALFRRSSSLTVQGGRPSSLCWRRHFCSCRAPHT